MAGRLSTVTTVMTMLVTTVASSACGDHSNPVSADRAATGVHASAAGGVSGGSTGLADVQLSGSAGTGSPFTDSLLTYTFQIKNAGPDSAPHATIVDTLPLSVRFAGTGLVDIPGTPNCTNTLTATSIIASCDFGTLKKGASLSMQVMVFAPDSAGAFSNTAHAVSSLPDPAPSNNAVTITTQAQVAKPVKVNPTPVPVPAPVPTVAFTTLPAEQFGGYVFAGGPSGVGFQFIPTVTGPLADLITATEASGGGRSEFWIYNDDPLNPDHAGTLLFGPIFGTIQSTFGLDVIAFPKGGPVLTAGQKYWLFGLGATGELSGLWHYSSNVLATTPCAIGPFPGIGGYGTCRYPAVQIVVLH